MKEYKIEIIGPAFSPPKIAEKAEKMLNEMATQGWEFKFYSGIIWVLEREKN